MFNRRAQRTKAETVLHPVLTGREHRRLALYRPDTRRCLPKPILRCLSIFMSSHILSCSTSQSVVLEMLPPSGGTGFGDSKDPD